MPCLGTTTFITPIAVVVDSKELHGRSGPKFEGDDVRRHRLPTLARYRPKRLPTKASQQASVALQIPDRNVKLLTHASSVNGGPYTSRACHKID